MVFTIDPDGIERETLVTSLFCSSLGGERGKKMERGKKRRERNTHTHTLSVFNEIVEKSA